MAECHKKSTMLALTKTEAGAAKWRIAFEGADWHDGCYTMIVDECGGSKHWITSKQG